MNSILNQNQFNTLFPYHLVVDRNMIICEHGNSIHKLKSELKGRKIGEEFEIFRPKRIELNFESLSSNLHELILLRLKSNQDLLFRYQIVLLDSGSLLFAGSVWLTDIRLLQENQLQLSDFALHDAMTDMLQVLRSKEIVMSEIKMILSDLDIQKKRLLEVKNQLGVVLENIPSALLVEDKNRKIVFTNIQFCRLFEIRMEPDQLIGFDCGLAGEQTKNLFQNEENFLTRIEELLLKGEKNLGELIEMKNGKLLERDFVPIKINDENAGILWQYKDVTHEKRTSFIVKQNEIKYRTLIENLSLGLLEVDLDGIIKRVYSSFCQLTGYTEDELINQKAVDFLLYPEDVARMESETNRRLSGVTSIYEVRLRKKDGSVIWVIISGAPIIDYNNKVIGSIGLHWDITNRIEKEEELKKARDLAEKSSRAKKEFMAKMSHELRTPLNVINGMAELLLNSELSPSQIEEVISIKKSNDQLTHLVSDLLDISMIESGKLKLNKNKYSLKETILDVSNHFYFKAKEKGISFNLKLYPDVPNFIYGDGVKLKQIFTNLLSNAVKFTDYGYVDFEIKFIGQNLSFKIKDSGIGIPEEKQREVYELFKQAHEFRNDHMSGSGLGLTITEELVHFLNGKIELKSREKEGTEFLVSIPIDKCEDDLSEKEISEDSKEDDYFFSKLNVLVAEDNLMNRQLMSKILNSWKIKFEFAENGSVALKKLEENLYDLILMDVYMPEMNGLESTQLIRTHPLWGIRNIPIIGLSAAGSMEETQACINAGMNEFIPKPIKLDVLKSSLKRWAFKNACDYKYIKLDYFDENKISGAEEISKIAEIYVNHTPAIQNKIDLAFELNNFTDVKLELHNLKSNVKIFGINELAHYLELLEKEQHLDNSELSNLREKINFIYKESLQEIQTLLNKT